MKFTVSQSSLTQALSIVMKGVANTTTLPILSGVLINARDGVLEFQTANNTISIRHRIAAHVEEEGTIVVPCKMLLNITKTLPDAAVTVESEGRTVHISCVKSSFRVNALDPDDFLAFPAYALENAVELPAPVLSDMVSRVVKMTSKDKTRPIYTGIHMTVENNVLRLEATDSYRMCICDTSVETSSLEGEFELLVPAAAFSDALSIMSGQGTILIGSTDTQAVFEAEQTTYVARLIEGSFPGLSRLIPTSSIATVKVAVDTFSTAIHRVAAVSGSGNRMHIEIDPDAGTLVLSSFSDDQDLAKETIDVEAEGQGGALSLNYHYMLDALASASGEENVSFEIPDYKKPCVFKAYGKVNCLCLIVPMHG